MLPRSNYKRLCVYGNVVSLPLIDGYTFAEARARERRRERDPPPFPFFRASSRVKTSVPAVHHPVHHIGAEDVRGDVAQAARATSYTRIGRI